MHEEESGETGGTWDGLDRRGKVLVSMAMTGIGLFSAAAVGVLLAVVAMTVTAFPGAAEVDGVGALLWAVLLVVPSALLVSALLTPVRLLLRGLLPARSLRYMLGWCGTFLTAGLVTATAPGLRCHSLWPLLCVATLDALLEALLEARSQGPAAAPLSSGMAGPYARRVRSVPAGGVRKPGSRSRRRRPAFARPRWTWAVGSTLNANACP
ncbi:hypothetical protein [Streptomyces sp. NPDC051452]|uniref:hypothetical protein n=1 Tax=Streptomyces sp. NPDC051452 TaxID=3365654 RepID=UPI0037BCDC3F